MRLWICLFAITLAVSSVQAQEAKRVAEGAQLWADNCTRCHNARAPMERTARDWKTIVNHMRARANLTKSEALDITAYFKMTAPKTVSVLSKKDMVPVHTEVVERGATDKTDLD